MTIPARLLPSLDIAAVGFRSRTAYLERRIIDATAIHIESRIIGLDFDGLTRLGRWLRVTLDNRTKIGENQSLQILDRLSSITIQPRTTQPRKNLAINLDGPTKALSVRTLPPIKAKAEANAEAAGLSLSAYCLRLMLSYPFYARPSRDDARIVSELGKIGGLLVLCDPDHLDLFSLADHHRRATQIVGSLLHRWRQG